jgi:RNA polymerase sigma factor (sigma-70 family)
MRTDADLLTAYAATGDESAFAELAWRHGPMVYRVCLRALARHHEAEDAAQAVFVILARKAGSLRRDIDLAAWLHGTARNAARWAARSEARRERREEAVAMVRAAENIPAGVGARHAVPLPGDVDAALAALPAEQRQAVILRYLENRTQEEAAVVAGCPQGTLARRATVGLERLRQRLARKQPQVATSALALALAADAGAALPETLLPSILVASKLAAVGVAAGAAGSTGLAIAEGAMKAMFWMKVKLAAAVLAAAAAVGAGSPFVYKAVAGDAPTAAAKANVIRAKVVKVEAEEKRPPVARVTISAGKAHGVRQGFVFDVLRDDKPLNPPPNGRELTIETVGETESVGSYPLASGVKVEAPRVGDLAVTKVTEVVSDRPPAAAAGPAAEAQAVGGLRLVLSSSRGQSKLAEGWGPGEGGGLMCPKCRGKEADGGPRKCEECKQDIKGRTWGKYCNPCAQDLARCAGCGLDMPGATVSYKLRWENVGKEPLIICPMSPLGGGGTTRCLLPGESHALYINQRPEQAGEYRLGVTFTQDKERVRVDYRHESVGFHGGHSTGAGGPVGPLDQQAMKGASLWTGKLRSNELKVVVPAAEAAGFGEPVRGLAVSLKVTPGEWPEGQIGKASVEIVLKNTGDRKLLVYKHLGRDADPNLLQIRDEAGRLWEYRRDEQVLLKDPTPADFLELAPGETKVVSMKLKPDEYYFALPPGGKRPATKTEAGTPSLDDRIPELPAGTYTLTYKHESVVEELAPGDSRTKKLQVVAKQLGHDDFWTGVVSSKPVPARVRPAQAARPPAPEVF